MEKPIESGILQKKTRRKSPPAKTPEARENQLINLAIALAEKKLMDGTASSQLITHFLKLATMKEQLENEKLKMDLKVSEAKIEQMKAQVTSAELLEKALKAFKSYSGQEVEDDEY